MGVVLPLKRWFYLYRRRLTFVGVVLPLWAWYFLCTSGFTLACVVFIYIFEVIEEGVSCLCGRGISFVGVVFTSVSDVLSLRACFYLRRRGYDI